MTSSGAHVDHLEAIVSFSDRFRDVAAHAHDEVQQILQRVERCLVAASDWVEQADAALDSARQAVEDADPTENADLERLREAEVEYQRALAAHDRIRDSAGILSKQVGQAGTTLDGLFAAGAEFLDTRIERIRAYLAIGPEERSRIPATDRSAGFGAVRTSGPAAAPRPATATGALRSAASAGELPFLPRGFVWVPITSLDLGVEEKRLAFEKVSRGEIERMMRTFESDILPMLSEGGLSRDRLVRRDRELGRVDPDGPVCSDSLVLAYDCLINSARIEADVIVLDRMPGHSVDAPRLDFASGRHRALVARDLGWTHIPAKLR